MKPASRRWQLSGLIAIVLMVATLLPSTNESGRVSGVAYVGVGVIAVSAGAFTTVVAVLSASSRRVARRLRSSGNRAFVARAENYFLGTIAQLRPEIANPLTLGRYIAIGATETGIQFWSGRDEVQLLDVPWKYVTSIDVEEGKIFWGSGSCLTVRLAGANRYPLKVLLCKPGVGVWLAEGLSRSDEIAGSLNAIRQAAPHLSTAQE